MIGSLQDRFLMLRSLRFEDREEAPIFKYSRKEGSPRLANKRLPVLFFPRNQALSVYSGLHLIVIQANKPSTSALFTVILLYL